MGDISDWKRCTRPSVLTYLMHPICEKHWVEICKLTETMKGHEICTEHMRSKHEVPKVQEPDAGAEPFG